MEKRIKDYLNYLTLTDPDREMSVFERIVDLTEYYKRLCHIYSNIRLEDNDPKLNAFVLLWLEAYEPGFMEWENSLNSTKDRR